jgi:hypothetical protein
LYEGTGGFSIHPWHVVRNLPVGQQLLLCWIERLGLGEEIGEIVLRSLHARERLLRELGIAIEG